MHPGKQKCKILKQIRKQIADANDIQYVIDECPHKGDCPGTCPKCEAEVRYLEAQLAERRRLGKAVAVVGLAAGLTAVASITSSCFRTNGELQPYALEGDVACPIDSDSINASGDEVPPAVIDSPAVDAEQNS